MDRVVRRANADDAPALADLYEENLADAYAGIALPESALTFDRIHRAERFTSTIADSSRLWLVVTDGGLVVGFCGLASARDPDLTADVGEVTTIAVDRLHRARGHGRVLLAAALDQAALKAWSQLVLWVVKTNLGACSFYEHMGFRCDSASRIDSRLGVDAPVVRYRIGLL